MSGINVAVVPVEEIAPLHECLGRFSVHRDFIRSNPQAVLLIMARCIVVRAEMMYESGCIEYTALSHDFDKCEEGMRAPWYDWIFESQPDGSTRVLRVERRDRF